jgi:integrase
MPTKRRQKGTGGLYQRADGMWTGSVDLGFGANGKRRRKVVYSKNQKTAARKLAEARKAVEQTGDIPTATQTVEAWCTYWLEKVAAPRVRPRTLTTYRGHVGQYIVPAIGRVRLDKLGPQHVRQVHTYLAEKGLSSTTAQHAHVTLVKCLTDAVREGLLPRNPAALVDAPRRAVSDRTALTAEQGIQLLLSVDSRNDPMTSRWAMALLTGQRQGECLGLEADRVFPDRIDVSWQLQRLPYTHGCKTPCGRKRGGNCPDRRLVVPAGFEYRDSNRPGLYLTRPKSKAGWRIIPLVDPLKTILERHLAGRTTGLVWTDDGKPVDPKDDNQAWHAALEAAGLPSVPLHAARHTTATLLLEAGVDAHVVAQILGQSSVVVARGYQHVSLALATDAMKALGAALSGDGSPSA